VWLNENECESKVSQEIEDILSRLGRREARSARGRHAGEVEGEEFLLLLKTARELAEQFKGRTIGYSRKVFIPLTNLCRNNCGYCAFRRAQGVRGPVPDPDEILVVVNRGADLGCKEALFTLGDKPEIAFPEAREDLRRLGFERTTDYLVAMCRLVIEHTTLLPHSNPGLWRNEICRGSGKST